MAEPNFIDIYADQVYHAYKNSTIDFKINYLMLSLPVSSGGKNRMYEYNIYDQARVKGLRRLLKDDGIVL
ncbi:hypothetical protein GF361_00505 [Candidatus Woesearchaeota archaeon]|nr:hypothetical protein [Candidatus Woesearchaeota archaeon]